MDTRFSVWRRKSDDPGPVRLGAMGAGPHYAMYGVAAKGRE